MKEITDGTEPSFMDSLKEIIWSPYTVKFSLNGCRL